MSAQLISLVWFALWAVMLGFFVVLLRVRQVMSGKAKADAFPSGEKHGPDAYWRVNRAQANTLENLPIFGALVLAGVASGVTTDIFAALCVVVVIARMVQSLIHLSSGSVTAINLRFAAYLVQIVCFAWIGIHLILQFYGM